MNKILFSNYIIEKNKPDEVVIWEAWLKKDPTGKDMRYDILRTKDIEVYKFFQRRIQYFNLYKSRTIHDRNRTYKQNFHHRSIYERRLKECYTWTTQKPNKQN